MKFLAVTLLLPLFVVAGCGEDPPTCEPNMQYCPEAGACRNLNLSHDHCGQCGRSCLPDWNCIMGCCTPGCPPHKRNCNVSAPIDRDGDCHYDGLNDEPALNCVDTSSDREHCGSCNNVCTEGEYCNGSACQTCEFPLVICRNVCVDLLRDIQHCGECDHPCTNGYCICGQCYDDDADMPEGTCDDTDGDADIDSDADVDGDADIDTDNDTAADADTHTDAGGDADTVTDGDPDS